MPRYRPRLSAPRFPLSAAQRRAVARLLRLLADPVDAEWLLRQGAHEVEADALVRLLAEKP